jgi:hypothetical protein
MIWKPVACLGLVLACTVGLRAENGGKSTEFEVTGYLYEGPDDEIWIARPMSLPRHYDLYKQSHPSRYFRLGAEMKAKFAALVNPINAPHDLGDEDLTVIVHLEGSATGVDEPQSDREGIPDIPPNTILGGSKVYEIDSAQLIDAEFIPASWRTAWQELDRLFREIPAATLKPPSAEKREALARLLEEASRHLNRMKKVTPEPEWEALAQSIDSDARLVTTYQETALPLWGRPVAWCVEWLGMQPETPLPGEFRTGEVLSRIEPDPSLINPVNVEDVGILIRLLDREVSRRFLILDGYRVERILREEANPGFAVGDIIPARTSWYQVFCGCLDGRPCAAGIDEESVRESFKTKLARKEKIHAIRGNSVTLVPADDE